jgi:hypothetical protein
LFILSSRIEALIISNYYKGMVAGRRLVLVQGRLRRASNLVRIWAGIGDGVFKIINRTCGRIDRIKILFFSCISWINRINGRFQILAT